MATEIHLNPRTPGATRQGRCIVCSRLCNALDHAPLLRPFGRVSGPVCPPCLEAGPGAAALALRRRAAQRRRFARRAKEDWPAVLAIALRRALLRQADEFDDLADHLKQRTSWPWEGPHV
jgi:hypothetical protein